MNVLVVHVPVAHKLQAVKPFDLQGEVEHFPHGVSASTVATQAVPVRAVPKRRQAGSKGMIRNHASFLPQLSNFIGLG
jgi:hypothetical protein